MIVGLLLSKVTQKICVVRTRGQGNGREGDIMGKREWTLTCGPIRVSLLRTLLYCFSPLLFLLPLARHLYSLFFFSSTLIAYTANDIFLCMF